MSHSKRGAFKTVLGICWLAACVAITSGALAQDKTPGLQYSADPDGTVHMSNLAVPPSAYLSPEALKTWISHTRFKMPPGVGDDALAQRTFFDQTYNKPWAEAAKAKYPVDIHARTIGGVRTEIITPRGGISRQNRHRVLINLHGGGFGWGEGYGGEVESVPIAAVGRIEVVTVAYREGPEYKFPDASEDVASVYRALLKTYKPASVGIYGCSAGGILTAESVAWFQKEGLPAPGAVGMFCGGPNRMSGDSVAVATALSGGTMPDDHEMTWPYFAAAHARSSDPLVYPGNSDAMMRGFPPSLLISSTRDFALSSVLHTQSQLTRLGVPNELHVWDGLPHAFFMDPDLPESTEVFHVIADFFDRRLRK